MPLLKESERTASFHNLTRLVKEFLPRAQLQSVKSYRSGAGWEFHLDFYPGPRGLAFTGSGVAVEVAANGRRPAAHPIQLYLRAYFMNSRVESALIDAGALVLGFSEGASLRFDFDRELFRVTAEVPDRKVFKQAVRLGTSAERDQEEPVVPKAASVRADRLRKNVEADRDGAQAWLERVGPLCEYLSAHPGSWRRADDLPQGIRETAEMLVAAGSLPSFGLGHRKVALEKLFSERRRQIRKVDKAGMRLSALEKVGFNLGKPKRVTMAAIDAPEATTRKPGLWIKLGEVWARVGKSAKENDELFRQAGDRDLWFHVRGSAGAHVWLARGQLGLGARGEAPDALLKLACQLALYNSKAREAGSVVVDFTERRYLKKIRGTPGAVRILRSATRITRLDKAFDEKVLGK